MEADLDRYSRCFPTAGDAVLNRPFSIEYTWRKQGTGVKTRGGRKAMHLVVSLLYYSRLNSLGLHHGAWRRSYNGRVVRGVGYMHGLVHACEREAESYNQH